MPTGKERMKEIRRLARDPELCAHKIRIRRDRLHRLKELDAPEVILATERRMLHDAEYAMSLIEGYYDPGSDINKRVWLSLHSQGFETMPEHLAGFQRRRIMEAFRDVCRKHDIPQEYGAVIRMMRALGVGQSSH